MLVLTVSSCNPSWPSFNNNRILEPSQLRRSPRDTSAFELSPSKADTSCGSRDMEYAVITARASRESTTNGHISNPGSNITDDLKPGNESLPKSTEAISPHPDTGENFIPSRITTTNGTLQTPLHHVIRLSSIEHCMPRAYIRVCLAYPLSTDADLDAVIDKLNTFVRGVVNSKPYLSGYVVPATEPAGRSHVAEIQFTEDDYLNYPHVKIRYLTTEEVPFTYKQLNERCLPPSVIRPELISALPEGTDDEHAPVFRMQANIVQGGLLVSVYLHHCISDGQGLGHLVSGKVNHDNLRFNRHLAAEGLNTPDFNDRLEAWCGQNCHDRSTLSWSFGNQISNREFKHKQLSGARDMNGIVTAHGRGCIFAFSKEKLEGLKISLDEEVSDGKFISQHDVLLALLWQHMTVVRKHSISNEIQISKLFIPVNIRSKIPNLPHAESYFGAAVDFACAELPVDQLADYHGHDPARLAKTAMVIRDAIVKVDETYVRQLIAFANVKDPELDMRDVMASNMNRKSGADMYITSWEKLELYEATLGMGLGKPDWVRKPWSRDPGSCVVLPRDDRKDYVEVLVQMTENDMARLLRDHDFMSFVTRTVDGPPDLE